MVEKPEYRGVVAVVPGITEAEQRALIAKYEPFETYELWRGVDQDGLIKQQRAPKAIVVSDAALLAEQKGKKADRLENFLWFKNEIHRKGGFIREARSGLRSDRPKDWRQMRQEADRMLGRLAKGSKSPANARRGADPYVHTDRHILTMLRIMESKRYTNDEQRIAAIRAAGVRPVPKRTWLLTKLKAVARERGLMD